MDNRIIALKRDINKLKDVLAEYGTYEVSEKKKLANNSSNKKVLNSFLLVLTEILILHVTFSLETAHF